MKRADFLKRAAMAPLIAVIPAPAFAEGASLPPIVLPNVPNNPFALGHQVIPIGFQRAVVGYEHVYPTLARALASTGGRGPVRATKTKIEWPGGWNQMQINRTPYGMSGTEMASCQYREKGGIGTALSKIRLQALHRHLADVEFTLLDGKRARHESAYRSFAFYTCGGVRQLGKGTPVLHTLRDLTLLTNRQSNDMDAYQEEFISEFSLGMI